METLNTAITAETGPYCPSKSDRNVDGAKDVSHFIVFIFLATNLHSASNKKNKLQPSGPQIAFKPTLERHYMDRMLVIIGLQMDADVK